MNNLTKHVSILYLWCYNEILFHCMVKNSSLVSGLIRTTFVIYNDVNMKE